MCNYFFKKFSRLSGCRYDDNNEGILDSLEMLFKEPRVMLCYCYECKCHVFNSMPDQFHIYTIVAIGVVLNMAYSVRQPQHYNNNNMGHHAQGIFIF